MKKKSLFEIAMERKKEEVNIDNNVVGMKKSSKILIIIELLCKILKLIFYIIIGLLLTIGTTVLANSELRAQLINTLNSNI